MERRFPELAELVAFFECEPALLDPDDPWFVNELTFETVRANVAVRAVIRAFEGYIDLSVRIAGREIAAAQVRARGEVKIHNDQGRETFSVVFGERSENTLWLTLQPDVRLSLEGRDGFMP